MTKIYNHAVIYNGVFYPSNTPIEVGENLEVQNINDSKETPKKAKNKSN